MKPRTANNAIATAQKYWNDFKKEFKDNKVSRINKLQERQLVKIKNFLEQLPGQLSDKFTNFTHDLKDTIASYENELMMGKLNAKRRLKIENELANLKNIAKNIPSIDALQRETMGLKICNYLAKEANPERFKLFSQACQKLDEMFTALSTNQSINFQEERLKYQTLIEPITEIKVRRPNEMSYFLQNVFQYLDNSGADAAQIETLKSIFKANEAALSRCIDMQKIAFGNVATLETFLRFIARDNFTNSVEAEINSQAKASKFESIAKVLNENGVVPQVTTTNGSKVLSNLNAAVKSLFANRPELRSALESITAIPPAPNHSPEDEVPPPPPAEEYVNNDVPPPPAEEPKIYGSQPQAAYTLFCSYTNCALVMSPLVGDLIKTLRAHQFKIMAKLKNETLPSVEFRNHCMQNIKQLNDAVKNIVSNCNDLNAVNAYVAEALNSFRTKGSYKQIQRDLVDYAEKISCDLAGSERRTSMKV